MHSWVPMLLLMLASLMGCQLLVIGEFLGAHTTLHCTLTLMTLQKDNVFVVWFHSEEF